MGCKAVAEGQAFISGAPGAPGPPSLIAYGFPCKEKNTPFIELPGVRKPKSLRVRVIPMFEKLVASLKMKQHLRLYLQKCIVASLNLIKAMCNNNSYSLVKHVNMGLI